MTATPALAGTPRNGFSLVELMVVLFVLGLLATVAVLSMPGDERALRLEAERFAARTSAARDEAITTASPVALVVSGAGYYFEQRAAGQWRPFAGDRFALTGWEQGTTAGLAGAANAAAAAGGTAAVEGAASGRTRLVFDPVGLASSEARVALARGGAALEVRIGRDGRVRVDGAR